MTEDSAFKKQVRARMAETGENYTTARRMIITEAVSAHPRVALRVYLNPQVDLELTSEMARAYAAADENGKRETANRLLADHLELAGAWEAKVAAGSSIVPVQDLDIAKISDAIHRRIPTTAGIDQVSVGGDQGTVLVEIQTARPGVVFGHGGAGVDRLRAELEELTGKPVHLTVTHPAEVQRLGTELEELKELKKSSSPSRPGSPARRRLRTAWPRRTPH